MDYAKTNKRSWIRDEQMLKQLNGFLIFIPPAVRRFI